MDQSELDEIKSHNIEECYLGKSFIIAQSNRLDDLIIKDLFKTNKCFGVIGNDLNDGNGKKYEVELFEFDMDCLNTKGKVLEEGMDTELSFNYGLWGGFGDSTGWKGICRMVPPPFKKLFEFDRGNFAQGVRGIIDPFDP